MGVQNSASSGRLWLQILQIKKKLEQRIIRKRKYLRTTHSIPDIKIFNSFKKKISFVFIVKFCICDRKNVKNFVSEISNVFRLKANKCGKLLNDCLFSSMDISRRN